MVKRIRMPYITGPNGLQVAAPTYSMVPGSHQPIQPGVNTADGVAIGVLIGDPKLAAITVAVDVPDEDVNAAGTAIDPVKVKARYPDHPLVVGGIIK